MKKEHRKGLIHEKEHRSPYSDKKFQMTFGVHCKQYKAKRNHKL